MNEAEPDVTDMLTVIILIQGIPAYTLFDTGSSISFVATSFISEHHLPVEPYTSAMIIETPTGTTTTSQWVKSAKITLSKSDFEANFFVLNLTEYDIIIGMY